MAAYKIEPIAIAESQRHRRPRIHNSGHLDRIRALPCVVCLRRPVEAAHIRSGSMKYGKRPTGAAEKPADFWCLPLCPDHHRDQHKGNELAFWKRFKIDPFATALSLWAASGDDQLMEYITRLARS